MYCLFVAQTLTEIFINKIIDSFQNNLMQEKLKENIFI